MLVKLADGQTFGIVGAGDQLDKMTRDEGQLRLKIELAGSLANRMRESLGNVLVKTGQIFVYAMTSDLVTVYNPHGQTVHLVGWLGYQGDGQLSAGAPNSWFTAGSGVGKKAQGIDLRH